MSGFDDSFTVTATMEGQSPQSGATSVKTNGSNVTKPAVAEARPSKDAQIEPVTGKHIQLEEVGAGGEYTALGDSRNALLEDQDDIDDEEDVDGKNPFKQRAFSMLPNQIKARSKKTNLQRTRSLSNGSLDNDTKGTGRRPNTSEKPLDVLLRKKQWEVYLKQDHRVPGTRTNWLPVTATLQDGLLTIHETSPKRTISPSSPNLEDHPPLGQLYLQHNQSVTTPMTRYYEKSKRSKIHQVKIQQTTFREKRTLRRFFFIEHVSQTQTLLKFGSLDTAIMESFISGIQEAIKQLPVTRHPVIAYRMNEMFIDVKDNSSILMNCNGAVLDRESIIKIFMQAFLTGSPECKLILNDVEAALRSTNQDKDGGASLLINQHIRLTNVVFHPCISEDPWAKQRQIVFRPIDACAFELLSCSAAPKVSPPITVSASMDYNEVSNAVRITATFSVKKRLNLSLRPITELTFKFPIPPAWHDLMAATRFGKSKSVRSTAGIRGSFRRKIKNDNCNIDVHLGSAKFEKEHSAIMWRIGAYHVSSVPHRFEATIRLEPGMERPDLMTQHAEVSYNIPGTSTGFNIKSLKVTGQDPSKWVKYEILYRYKLQLFPDLSVD